jgi:hypothetical protein
MCLSPWFVVWRSMLRSNAWWEEGCEVVAFNKGWYCLAHAEVIMRLYSYMQQPLFLFR